MQGRSAGINRRQSTTQSSSRVLEDLLTEEHEVVDASDTAAVVDASQKKVAEMFGGLESDLSSLEPGEIISYRKFIAMWEKDIVTPTGSERIGDSELQQVSPLEARSNLSFLVLLGPFLKQIVCGRLQTMRIWQEFEDAQNGEGEATPGGGVGGGGLSQQSLGGVIQRLIESGVLRITTAGQLLAGEATGVGGQIPGHRKRQLTGMVSTPAVCRWW